MKMNVPLTTLVMGLLSSSVFAYPWHRGHYYSHYSHYCYRPVYGRHFSFGFGYGGYAPVYYAPPPVVYYTAPVFAPPPVIVQQPVMAEPSPVADQPSPSNEQSPKFVETNRRLHQHGDNEGKVDWIEGLLDGHAVRFYYDDFGRVQKQKWLD